MNERVRNTFGADRVARTGRLVAAGVVLRGHQDEAWAGRLRLAAMAECAQDSDDGDISGKDSKSNGGDHGKGENKRHEQRNHGNQPLTRAVIRCTP